MKNLDLPNIGQEPNDKKGDNLRKAFQKSNQADLDLKEAIENISVAEDEEITLVMEPGESLGGKSSGDVVAISKSMNLNDLIKELGVKTLNSTAPTANLTSNPPASDKYEIGEVLNINFGIQYSRGDHEANSYTDFKVQKNNVELGSLSDSINVSQNAVTYKGSFDYPEFTPTNKATIPAADDKNTNSGSNKSFSGIYPFYYWVSDNQETSIPNNATKLMSGSLQRVGNGKVSINFGNSDFKYLHIAYPASYNTKKTWKENELNQGDIGSASDLFGAATTNSESSKDTPSRWSNVNYKIHSTNSKTSFAGSIEIDD